MSKSLMNPTEKREVDERSMPKGIDPDSSWSIFDALPLASSGFVAWWTTVRPGAFSFAGNGYARLSAWAALLGLFTAASFVYRRPQWMISVLLALFVFPCVLVWFFTNMSATALSEPIEVFVGSIAWVTLGLVMIRPQSVRVPKGAQGSGGPVLASTDDASKLMSVMADSPPPLLSRVKLSRFASIPLWVGAAVAAFIAFQTSRVGAHQAERAVLSRLAGAAIVVALLSAAGDLVEARYQTRVRPKIRTRFARALVALAALAVLLFVGLFLFRGDR